MAHIRRKVTASGKVKYQARHRLPDGKERTREFDRERDAKKWAAEQEVAVARDEWTDPSLRHITVAELGERLLASKADRRTKEWNGHMLRHVNTRWGATRIGAVHHLDMQTWIDELVAGGDVGVDTIRGAYRVLHEVVALALRSRLIGHDPCLGVNLPRVNRREMLFLDGPQVNVLADEIEDTYPGHGWGVLVRFAAYSGLRAGEIGHLQVRHLEPLRHRVHVVGSRKTYGVDGDTKTKAKRWVDLPRQLCDDLAAHLAARDHRPDARVWTGVRGEPLNHQWFYQQRFKPVVIRLSDAGLLPVHETDDGKMRTLRFHDLRHTCVALLIESGAQQYEVMEHVGHTVIGTTINTYGHMFPSVRDRIRSALEEQWERSRVG